MNIIVANWPSFHEFYTMKSLLLLAFGASIFIMSSCSSEYTERLNKAKELKAELEKAISQQRELGIQSHEEVLAIQQEINFHAKVSGNEELFIKQLSED